MTRPMMPPVLAWGMPNMRPPAIAATAMTTPRKNRMPTPHRTYPRMLSTWTCAPGGACGQTWATREPAWARTGERGVVIGCCLSSVRVVPRSGRGRAGGRWPR
ncbi:hypothetical protein [Ornithinimicrobium kibberense]|uniref:hypothetical protein n=1 Tax=Ornithinimicrobium kibberense TaxID=282060 RepID=UPI003621AD23